MTTLRSVIAYLATMIRWTGIAYIVVQVAIWHSFYTQSSWRMLAPALAVAWAGAVTPYLGRHWPSPFLTWVDSAAYAVAAPGLPGAVQLIGDPGTPQPPVARAVLAALDAVLNALPPHQVVLTVLASGEDVELYLTFSAPLRAVPDLTRYGLDVPAAARWHASLRTTETGEGFLEVSASDRPVAVRAAMYAGARGYALKNEQADQIRSAIREVAAGRDWISPRLACIFATDDDVGRPTLSHQERRALQLYATGLPLKSVAKKMAISEETVKQYLGRVRQKYTLAGRAAPTKLELYHRAVEDGHLPPTP